MPAVCPPLLPVTNAPGCPEAQLRLSDSSAGAWVWFQTGAELSSQDPVGMRVEVRLGETGAHIDTFRSYDQIGRQSP